MNTLAKVIASVAALIAACALAWIAKKNGVTVYSGIVDVRFDTAVDPRPEIVIRHESGY